MLKFSATLFLIFIARFANCQPTDDSSVINIVFTSDAHYGIARSEFRGQKEVPSYLVNRAMISQINSLPSYTLPKDKGVGAGKKIHAIDYLAEGGDISNRMEIPIQTAAQSWEQFKADYIDGLKLTGHNGSPAQLLLIPGNHDVSNAIGYPKPMQPATDPTSMVGIYNLMLHPAKLLTNGDYNYVTDKVNYSRNINGMHFLFITLWADSLERLWMQKDLDSVPSTTPVIIFAHDQPTCEAKHFTNPVPPHDINSKNKFQNLVAEYYKEGENTKAADGSTDIEQLGFVQFLKAHPNIVAYFHGNSNWNEFYTYKGPKNDVHLKTFRVDSPIKGKYSSKDEKLLSFHLISLDHHRLTVRECLWNTDPSAGNAKIKFGSTETISLK